MSAYFRAIRYRLEVFSVRLAMALVPRLPRPLLCRLADTAGLAGYWLLPKLRRLVLCNLKLALGAEFSDGQRRKLARRIFRNFALVFLDFFWFGRHTAKRLRQYVEIDDWLLQFSNCAQAIGVTAHFGNWELLAQALAMRGIPIAAVAAPLANAEVDKCFRAFRANGGVKIIEPDGAIRKLLHVLHGGGNVALLLDQNVKIENGGVFVDFFGLPVPMSNAAAALAEHTRVCILALFCKLQPQGRYRIYSCPPWCVVKSTAEDPAIVRRETTQHIAALFEAEIRRHPEQWLWMYKRWKHIPPGMPPTAYPYYAKPAHRENGARA